MAVRLDTKLVIVLSETLTEAAAANAAAVLGLAAAAHTSDLGAVAVDADGRQYGALDRHPIPLLVASADDLRTLHRRAEAEPELQAIVFTEDARRSRNYDDYVAKLAETNSIDVTYVGLVVYGPRKRVSTATNRLPLFQTGS